MYSEDEPRHDNSLMPDTLEMQEERRASARRYWAMKVSAAQTPHHGRDALSVRPNTNPSSKPREES